MKSKLFFRLCVILVCSLLFFNFLYANDYYISNNGRVYDVCRSGPDFQWNSLRLLKDKCLKPGDRVVFSPGVYRSNIIENNDLSVNVSKDSLIPVSITADNFSGKWPVKFVGDGFNITSGGPVVVENIEFFKEGNSRRSIIAIGIGGVVLRGNYIHGEHVYNANNQLERTFDCIYAPISENVLNGLLIERNIVEDCSQDAIDIPGSSNVKIYHNLVRRSLQVQVKGGGENIEIRNNDFENNIYGVVGGTMKCPFYCASPSILALPVQERYNACNVTISSNSFKNIAKNWIVNFTGWKDVSIFNNTIDQNLVENRQEVFAGFDWSTHFFDENAIIYCENDNILCERCIFGLDSENCVSIKIPFKNIKIANNNIYLKDQLLLKYFSFDSHESTVLFENNNLHGKIFVDRLSFDHTKCTTLVTDHAVFNGSLPYNIFK